MIGVSLIRQYEMNYDIANVMKRRKFFYNYMLDFTIYKCTTLCNSVGSLQLVLIEIRSFSWYLRE